MSASKILYLVPSSWEPLYVKVLPSPLLRRVRVKFLHVLQFFHWVSGPAADLFLLLGLHSHRFFFPGTLLIDLASRVHQQIIALLHVFRYTPVLCGWILWLFVLKVRSSASTQSKNVPPDALPLSLTVPSTSSGVSSFLSAE